MKDFHVFDEPILALRLARKALSEISEASVTEESTSTDVSFDLGVADSGRIDFSEVMSSFGGLRSRADVIDLLKSFSLSLPDTETELGEADDTFSGTETGSSAATGLMTTAALTTTTMSLMTTSAVVEGELVSDDFASGSLDAVWTVEGPTEATATLGSSGSEAYLELVSPDGSYDIWDTNNSVRAMQAAEDVDFQIETRFLTTPTEKYQMQGLLIEQDENNWIRLDTYSDGKNLYAFAAITTDGDSSSEFKVAITGGEAPYLRVTREGDVWTLEYSVDGETYETAGSFSYEMTVTQVGVFAANTGRAPGYTAQVDYFENTAAPLTEEDGTIVSANTAPAASDDSLATTAGSALVITVASDLLDNDSDPDGDTLTVTGFTQPENGTLVDNLDGTWSYTPDDGFSGTDSFTYTVSDGDLTDTATVSLTVSAVVGENTAPVATDDALETTENTALLIAIASDLLDNDSDPEGDSLTVTGFTQPGNGTLVDNGDGTWSYTPVDGFSGTDSFTYTVSDGDLTDTATVSLTVTDAVAENVAPEASDDTLETVENTALLITVSTDLLGNDTDADGDTISVTGFTQPANGTLVDNGDGTWSYTPDDGYTGADSFTYTVTDGELTDTATVDLTVSAVVEPSDLVSDDFAGGSLDAMWVVEGPTEATATLGTSGSEAYLELVSPDGSYNIWDSNGSVRAMQATVDGNFQVETRFLTTPTDKYQMQGLLIEQDENNWIRMDTYSDGTNLFVFAAITIDGDSSSEIKVAVPEGEAPYLRVTREGDSWTLEYSVDGVTYVTAGTFSHEMTVSQVGVFAANTGQASGYTAQVDYFVNTAAPLSEEDGTIVPVNAAPVASDDNLATTAGVALLITVATDLLGNDSDADGDTLTVTGFTQPDNGTLVDNLDGTWSYTPDDGFSGTDSFTYTVSDGTVTDTATVSLSVAGGDNAAPVATDDALATTENTALLIAIASDLLGNDSDADGDSLTVTGFTQPSNGTLVDNGDGSWSYTPDDGFTGTDSFTYTVTDGDLTDTATVELTVTGAGGNTAPEATDDTLATAENTALLIAIAADLLSNDSDAEGDTLSMSDFTLPENGTLIDNGDGTLSYTPDDGFSGTDSFTYTVTDGEFTDTATVAVTVGNPIDVWYGLEQSFGTPGEAQEWINVLGSVSGDVASLSYTLNGGEERELSIGPDGRRLESAGDFNIDLSYSELDGSSADDVITIIATMANGDVYTTDVTVAYESGNVWSANYSIDWETVDNIQDVVQVADGLWTWDENGASVVDTGYDRMLVLGDQSWDNYQLDIQLTMNDLTNESMGIGFLWNGHTDDPIADKQPNAGWNPGAAFFYKANTKKLKSHSYHDWSDKLGTVGGINLEEGHTYNFQVKVEQIGIYDRQYSIKIWEVGLEEPTEWTLQTIETFSLDEAPATGSIYLDLHHYDVTFGDLTVTEITGNDIIQGDDTAEIQVAADTTSSTPGQGEIDVFVGAGGADLFVFGDENGTYYDDGVADSTGEEDYGFIWDYEAGTDQIQLAGSSSDYVLTTDAADLTPGTAIWLQGQGDDADELVAVINGIYGLDLDGTDFVYVSLAVA